MAKFPKIIHRQTLSKGKIKNREKRDIRKPLMSMSDRVIEILHLSSAFKTI